MPFSGFQDLDPAFAASLQDYFAANPGLGAYSGFRSRERQQQLFDASDRSGHMVARPGHSQHEFGRAADLRFNDQPIRNLPPEQIQALHHSAGEYGLTFPMSWEPWHVEPIGARSGAHASAPKDQGSDLAQTELLSPMPLSGLPAGPEDGVVNAYQRPLPFEQGFGSQQLMEGIIGGTLKQDLRRAMFKRVLGMFL